MSAKLQRRIAGKQETAFTVVWRWLRKSNRKGLDRIISMFPRLRILHLSRDVLRALGGPDARPTHPRLFPKTLQRLTLDGFEHQYRHTADGRATTAFGGVSYSSCHMQSLCELLAQFGVIQELVICRIAFDCPDGAVHEEPKPAWKIRSLTLCHANPTKEVLSRLYATPLASLHLMSGHNLIEIVHNIPDGYISQLEELSLWAHEIDPYESMFEVIFPSRA